MIIKVKTNVFKILCFDLEARPLSWINQDFVSKEVTAIAARFVGEKKTYCWLLGEDEPEDMIEGFLELYNQADMITGHYIRSYDLPLFNSFLTEYGYSPLPSKLSHDTKNDLLKRQGTSNSQENLADMLGVESGKVKMTQSDWREANRLYPSGIQKTKRRVIGDIDQHIELRAKLLEQGMLGPPKVWKSA